ncbi:GyrI-like domain-containing protein [candidate division TA06 bacterium]|nr:GyrI-like domain-containing protein [candidate division TA06 bacterium]
MNPFKVILYTALILGFSVSQSTGQKSILSSKAGTAAIQVKKTEAQTVVAAIHYGPYDQIGQTMGKLFAWLGKNGIQPAGSPSTVYFMDPEVFSTEELLSEVRIPIPADKKEVIRKKLTEVGMRVFTTTPVEVAYTMHKGPYEEIGSIYASLFQWVRESDYEFAGAPMEVYLSDPQNTKPQELLTEVQLPVMKFKTPAGTPGK